MSQVTSQQATTNDQTINPTQTNPIESNKPKRGRKPGSKTKIPEANTMQSHQQVQINSQDDQVVKRSVRIAQQQDQK